ncbi:MAG: phosphate ABC transporter substrate-binding protein PstS, partial [Bryobacteraceae bacterium]
MKNYPKKSLVMALAAGAFCLAGCGGASSTEAKVGGQPASGTVKIKGAGSTFAYLAYQKWFDAFKKDRQTEAVVYEPTSSADGIKQLQAGTVDFAATEIPLTDEEVAKFKVKPMHIPALMGAIVPIYNVAGVDKQLNFTAKALADIFSGKIRKWNDPELTKANPDVTLPGESIAVVHRNDGSGTTYALTDFLSKTSPDWKKNFGKTATVK